MHLTFYKCINQKQIFIHLFVINNLQTGLQFICAALSSFLANHRQRIYVNYFCVIDYIKYTRKFSKNLYVQEKISHPY